MNITKCRVCDSEKLEDCIDLGDQPWCNDFVPFEEVGKERQYPLMCCFCHNCSTLQVRYTVPKEIMYSKHLYISGFNKYMPSFFQKITDHVCSEYLSEHEGFVVDIGSNDGTLLKEYKKRGFHVLGIEPNSDIARMAIAQGIPTIDSYFDNEVAERLVQQHGKAKIISAANVFYHVEDLHSVVDGVRHLLSKEGVFVIQASYLPSLIETKAFDVMYHEHLLYYRLENLKTLLSRHSLEIFDFSFENVHGGSIVVYAGHPSTRKPSRNIETQINQENNLGFGDIDIYRRFDKQIKTVKKELVALLKNLKMNGATIGAYGAPAKGTVMLNYCGINSELVDFAAEVNKLKFDKYIPGTGIQIKDEFKCVEPDYYLLLSWNFKDEFIEERKVKNTERKYIIPIPKPTIL